MALQRGEACAGFGARGAFSGPLEAWSASGLRSSRGPGASKFQSVIRLRFDRVHERGLNDQNRVWGHITVQKCWSCKILVAVAILTTITTTSSIKYDYYYYHSNYYCHYYYYYTVSLIDEVHVCL